jgi:hypothetical protein
MRAAQRQGISRNFARFRSEALDRRSVICNDAKDG